MFEDNSLVLEISSPLVNQPPIRLDLRVVNECERRLPEVAIVTPIKAPELLMFFNQGWLAAKKLETQMELELDKAKTDVNRVKSPLVLDKIPELLAAKGLVTGKDKSGSADLREMMLMTFPQYVAAIERVQQLTAVVQWLKDKAEGIRMAYSSVKRIHPDDGRDPYRHSNPGTTGGGGTAQVGEAAPSSNGSGYTGFGVADYSR